MNKAKTFVFISLCAGVAIIEKLICLFKFIYEVRHTFGFITLKKS